MCSTETEDYSSTFPIIFLAYELKTGLIFLCFFQNLMLTKQSENLSSVQAPVLKLPSRTFHLVQLWFQQILSQAQYYICGDQQNSHLEGILSECCLFWNFMFLRNASGIR